MTDPFSTRAYIRSGFLGFVSLVTISLLGYTAHWLAMYEPARVVNAAHQLSRGLADSPISTAASPGYWYLLGSPQPQAFGLEAADLAANPRLANGVFALNNTNSQLLPVPESGALGLPFSFTFSTDEQLVGTRDHIHPALVEVESGAVTRLATPSGWLESPLRPNPFVTDTGRAPVVAYAYYDGPLGDAQAEDAIENWVVVVHDPNTGATLDIPEAVSPVWFNGGADIAYVRAGGIYQYHFASATEYPVVQNWSALTAATQIAIAPNSQAMVLTIPAINTLFVYGFLDATQNWLRELGGFAEAGQVYRDPTFSPDGTQYAVLQVRPGDTSAQLVVREVRSRQPVEVFILPFTSIENLSLLDWRGTLAPLYEPLVISN